MRILIAFAAAVVLLTSGCMDAGNVTAPDMTRDLTSMTDKKPELIKLPEPRLSGNMSLEEALRSRRSVREYADGPLELEEISQLLWSAQGETASWGGRTAPSAGALYPLEVYLIAGYVNGLDNGIFKYVPQGHELTLHKEGDVLAKLQAAALGQSSIGEAAVDILIAAAFERTAARYGERAARYIYMEAGHAAQNICLQATALGLGTVPIGAFNDKLVSKVVGLPANEDPLYILPVGRQ